MKDRFRYAFLRPFKNQKHVPRSSRYLAGMAIIAFLIATLGSVASGFIVWQWLPVQFGLFALGIVLVAFIILWLLSTKVITYELPDSLSTPQKLRVLFLSHHGKTFNGCFWTLIVVFIFVAPTLFTLTLLPAIDQFHQQQFTHEKALKLQKSESDYSQPLELVNKDIEEERNSFDLLVNEEGGDDIENIGLAIKSLENLEEEKFYLLQEFSQEDAQLKQLALMSPRSLFNLSLPSHIGSTQENLLKNQAHWKYSVLKFSSLFVPLSLIIALLIFKIFQPKTVSQYLNQQLTSEIDIEPKNTFSQKTTHDESALSATSLLNSNKQKPPAPLEPNLQQEVAPTNFITLLMKKRALILSEIKSLEHNQNPPNLTKELFVQKRNFLEKNKQALSKKILEILLEDAKTALDAPDNEKNSAETQINTKKLLNAR